MQPYTVISPCLLLLLFYSCAPAEGYSFLMAQSQILNLLSTYCMLGLVHTETDQMDLVFKELTICRQCFAG